MLYYPAKIEAMDPSTGGCTVTFSEYGNTEVIELKDLVSPTLPKNVNKNGLI